MKEDSGRILEAMDHLDPALIEDMDGQTTVKRRPAPVRVVLIAACVGALLITAVAAAEVAGVDVMATVKSMLGIQVSEIHTWDDEDGEMTGWGVRGSAEPEWLPEAFWAELQGVPLDEQGFGHLYKDFDGRESLENYMGHTLPDNPMLKEDTEYWDMLVSIAKEEAEEIVYILLSSTFEIVLSESGEQPPASVNLRAWTSSLGQEGSVGYGFDNVMETDREIYVTSNGLEATISKLYFEPFTNEDGTEYYYMSCIADFYLDGFNYQLSISESLEREALAEEILKQVLDAYPVS